MIFSKKDFFKKKQLNFKLYMEKNPTRTLFFPHFFRKSKQKNNQFETNLCFTLIWFRASAIKSKYWLFWANSLLKKFQLNHYFLYICADMLNFLKTQS